MFNMEANNMKKIFLILSLTALINVGLYAIDMDINGNGSNEKVEFLPTVTPIIPSNLGESFVNALGMSQSAGGGDTGAPSSGGSAPSLGVTTNTGSFTSSQTVTNGTPYSYGK
jgi:hypothetical protein